MDDTIANSVDSGNSDTALDPPEYLIIHCPRVTQRARWDEWAVEAATFLRMHGWTTQRIGPDMHAFHNIMVGAQ